MTSLSLLIQLSQCNSTGTESGNGGQFKREIIVKKKSDLFLKIRRNNWHGAFLQNITSESIENEKNCFHHSSTLMATAQTYLHFGHVYLHSVIQDCGPRRRGRITRNLDFASSFYTTTKQKSKESTNTKKEKCMGSQSSSCERTLSRIYL